VRDERVHFCRFLDRTNARRRIILRPSLLRSIAPPEDRPKAFHRIHLENLGIHRESENAAQGVEVVASGLGRTPLAFHLSGPPLEK
jgi:hypothetical protein